ncbi:hypothetical protein KR200_000160, partial [Drosophila serrata]
MFLLRSLLMSPQLQQRWMSSDQKLHYHWRPVPVEIPTRSSIVTDQKRPPLLLVKSFLNLRQMNNDYGQNIMRVTDELSFQPHRNIFIDII